MIHGHMAGWFGRDFYECARIEALGPDWVIVRTEKGVPWSMTCNTGRLDEILVEGRDMFDTWFCEHDRPKGTE